MFECEVHMHATESYLSLCLSHPNYLTCTQIVFVSTPTQIHAPHAFMDIQICEYASRSDFGRCNGLIWQLHHELRPTKFVSTIKMFSILLIYSLCMQIRSNAGQEANVLHMHDGLLKTDAFC